jgi:hypothetical protein
MALLNARTIFSRPSPLLISLVTSNPSGIPQDDERKRPVSVSDFLRRPFNMGIPDDLSRSHDQLEEDGPVEKDQLLVSLCSVFRESILPSTRQGR